MEVRQRGEFLTQSDRHLQSVCSAPLVHLRRTLGLFVAVGAPLQQAERAKTAGHSTRRLRWQSWRASNWRALRTESGGACKACANHTFVGSKDSKARITRASAGDDTQKWGGGCSPAAQQEAPAFSPWVGGGAVVNDGMD